MPPIRFPEQFVVSPMSDCVYSVLSDDVLLCLPIDCVPAACVFALVFFQGVVMLLCVCVHLCVYLCISCQYGSVVKVLYCFCISLSISLPRQLHM